jgi:nitrogenase molybdenum-cofactor synthesis protein NifE
MTTAIDKLTADGCSTGDRYKVCRSRGGESCAFDGAMIVLQPIADTAQLVHGPISCCGNSWEGRGTRSSKADLHGRGFTTDMREIDIVYGSEEKLLGAIRRTNEEVKPKAIFVHATCVSGLIGEDIDAVCHRAEVELGIRVIPVHAPGFTGPKNLGNRIAGEVLLEFVIGTGETPVMTHADINLIGEYNIAGDLWMVEPVLNRAGFRVLSRITGDSTFEEITWAHQARLNVVVCGRALINVAKEMERRYGIPYVEVSFFGRTETAKALRAIRDGLLRANHSMDPAELAGVDELIRAEEIKLQERLQPYLHLRGKRAVLYTGGVKSWSFISALGDLGIEVVAVGTKKSTAEDEEKMRDLLGPDAPLVEDVAPKNLLKLLQGRGADMLIAGGRNKYLAAKEGYPFVDVNQERHRAFAGYEGLVNLAKQISDSIRFYERDARGVGQVTEEKKAVALTTAAQELLIDPLKHSPATGAVIALQGLDGALPLIHGAQGCGFLGKVLVTSHFHEPIALATSKLFVEDVVMGSEVRLAAAASSFIEKNAPALVGVLTTGLSEVKGDDVKAVVKDIRSAVVGTGGNARIVHIPTPDYDGGLETGYARAVETLVSSFEFQASSSKAKQVNVLAGSYLTPADVNEIRDLVEAFGLSPVILPDLSALDGSREGVSALASGGTTIDQIKSMNSSLFTLAIGSSLGAAAKLLQEHCGVAYEVLDAIAGLEGSDELMTVLARISGMPVPARLQRQRQMLVDGMRDAHEHFGSASVCLALEPDHAVQTSRWLDEMGATVGLVMVPQLSQAAERIMAREVRIGGFGSIEGKFDVLIASSHGERTARKLGATLYETGFPVFRKLGYTSEVTIGFRGTLAMINDVGNLLMRCR